MLCMVALVNYVCKAWTFSSSVFPPHQLGSVPSPEFRATHLSLIRKEKVWNPLPMCTYWNIAYILLLLSFSSNSEANGFRLEKPRPHRYAPVALSPLFLWSTVWMCIARHPSTASVWGLKVCFDSLDCYVIYHNTMPMRHQPYVQGWRIWYCSSTDTLLKCISQSEKNPDVGLSWLHQKTSSSNTCHTFRERIILF